MKSAEEMLLMRYNGAPLLTLEEIAEVFRRKPQGLRVTLGRDNELSRQLATARKKVGRRVLYKTSVVAQLVDGLLLDEN